MGEVRTVQALPPSGTSVRDQVREALGASPRPMTVDELALTVFRKVGVRERNAVHVALHLLSTDGLIEKRAATYSLARPR